MIDDEEMVQSSSLPLKYTMQKVLMKTDTGQSMKQAIQVMIGTAMPT